MEGGPRTGAARCAQGSVLTYPVSVMPAHPGDPLRGSAAFAQRFWSVPALLVVAFWWVSFFFQSPNHEPDGGRLAGL